MKLEVVVVPVADVDRSKNFYKALGWREDADVVAGDDFRAVQLTPPGSGCSVIFGTGVTSAAPGSMQGLYLIVDDIDAARSALIDRGADVGEVFHDAGGALPEAGTGGGASPARLRTARATSPSPPSATPTATAGCSRRSPPVFLAGEPGRHTPR
ncbi:VOC family protein [Nonomuraea recticatena]|uniref:VOC family protein n=1 Tax=Nonomuraea recticatena TaxID=46178 RepID=UPI003609630D